MADENTVRQLGTTFDYTWYFEKRRNRLYKQRKSKAKEFIEALETAIIVAVRMTSGNVSKILNLTGRKPMERNKLCNVCQTAVSADIIGTITHFRAQRVFQPGDYSNDEGFTLDWVHEEADHAEELGPFEWISGPLLLCSGCSKTMIWYEEETHWKHIQRSIEKRNLKDLPPLFSLYASLEKSLRLAEFFGLQVAMLMRNPVTNAQSLDEIKHCISNSCGVINVIGKQIDALGNENGNHPKSREKRLQRNIAQYCSFVVSELGCLFAINHEKMEDASVVINIPNNFNEKPGAWDSICRGFRVMFCRPDCASPRLQTIEMAKEPTTNNVLFDQHK